LYDEAPSKEEGKKGKGSKEGNPNLNRKVRNLTPPSKGPLREGPFQRREKQKKTYEEPSRSGDASESDQRHKRKGEPSPKRE